MEVDHIEVDAENNDNDDDNDNKKLNKESVSSIQLYEEDATSFPFKKNKKRISYIMVYAKSHTYRHTNEIYIYEYNMEGLVYL